MQCCGGRKLAAYIQTGRIEKRLSNGFKSVLNANSALDQIWPVLPEKKQQRAVVTAGISTSQSKTHHSRKKHISCHDCQDRQNGIDREGRFNRT